ncbi:hypothetical protein EIP91_002121 [Steccherinum ochraceum]|uniref:NAD(P)-binding protein n=1 Tax=Steccherinum ochraceum TaxID=92696 RepID=A0A4R0RCQ6_9APHY|nr:hypothetical protein EIP91_002121 [Steccherinum ochraceum]
MDFIRNFIAWASETFPPKSKFSVDQIPDLSGRIFIVTGGNSGIGYETVKALLQHNGKVYIASRNKGRVDAAIESLKKDTGNEALFIQLDLASLASVRRAAKDFLSKEKELHVLFNNAGVMNMPLDELTEDGYDYQLGANTLGHFYFTELLMPALFAGKETSPDGHARVITTSSSGAHFDTLHYETFRDGPKRRKMLSMSLYSQSKFGNIVVARQVAQRYADQGILSMSLNPGNLKSDLQKYFSPIAKALTAILLYDASYGALTQLWAGLMPDSIQHNGLYLRPWARLGRARKEAYDPEVGERFWNWLQEQVTKFELENKIV